MKDALIFLLIGAFVGAFALHFYDQHEARERAAARTAAPERAQPKPLPPENAPESAVSRKLAEWHLTPDDIRNDLAKTGKVVRAKSHEIGEKIDDARIVTVIKAKFVLDRDLSAPAIHVESHNGAVTLDGSVAAPGLIGKAVVLSLDTAGVRSVDSKLRVATP